MRKLLTTAIALWLSIISFGQTIVSGEYDSGLSLAYDSITNLVTGYYENYTGLDELTGKPKFSCIFYIQGTKKGTQFPVVTYYPNDSSIINGTMQIIDNKTLSLQLTEEHGGCWNVQHFKDEPVRFSVEKSIPWTQIRFITSNKTHFYSDKKIEKKQKADLVKNYFVCIRYITSEWAFCTYYGKTITKGWIRTKDLNKL